jgi:protein SCO1/2
MIKIVFSATALLFSLSVVAESKVAYPSDSIFWLNSDWVRHDGKKMKLVGLSETATIVSMVFLGCKYSCPLTIQDMREMDQKLLRRSKQKYKMVLISIDPDRDTPGVMQKFMVDRKLDPDRWLLLSSSQENIRELAAALGFSYKKDQAMDFAHSMLTWTFDREGVRRFTRSARKETINETVESFVKLLQ